jgi:hypothetical protein
MEERKKWLGMLRQRACLVPTWRGWLALLLCLAVPTVVVVRGLHPFLAINEPLPGGALVVEGWLPDYALKAVLEEFRQHHYDKVYVTGGPLEWGSPLIQFRSYAEGGAATLAKLGLDTNQLQAVPAPPVRQDRTYASAVALRTWWREHGVAPTKVHLFTAGPHARRSRLLFEKALGKGVAIGVTAIPAWDYDADHWWRSSVGVRTVSDEALAYFYARFLFRASSG